MTAGTLPQDWPELGGAVVRPHRPQTSVATPWVRPINRLSRPRVPFEHRMEGLSLRVGVELVCLDGAPAMPEAAEIGFTLADGSGFGLRLPNSAVQRILQTVQPELESPMPEPAGSLLLELALAPLLDEVETRLGQSLRISGMGPAAAEPGFAVLVLTATFGTEIVPMQVDLGPVATERVPDRLATLLRLIEAAPVRRASVGKLPVWLAFVVGRVRLTWAEIASLAPGDTVLPDVWHLAQGEVVVTIAERFAARAALDEGAARLKGPLDPVADDEVFAMARKEAGMEQNGHSAEGEPTDGQPLDGSADGRPNILNAAAEQTSTEEATETSTDGADRPAANLGVLEVALTFELARRPVEFAELETIGVGHVFDLGLDPKGPVELRAQGVRIGIGEVVEIGERLGVRVVRLFA